MLNLKPSPLTNSRAIAFLKQNPSISLLLNDNEQDLQRITTIIEPVLDAPNRCEMSPYYIQAVTTGRTAFLTTNLFNVRETHVTEVATNWLLGRDSSCAVLIKNASVSRFHAVIGHCSHRGFYITDVGSRNGTRVNRRRLAAQEQRFLNDGDLIELSSLNLEFFVSGWREEARSLQDTNY